MTNTDQLICPGCRANLNDNEYSYVLFFGKKIRLHNYITMPCCLSREELLWGIN